MREAMGIMGVLMVALIGDLRAEESGEGPLKHWVTGSPQAIQQLGVAMYSDGGDLVG